MKKTIKLDFDLVVEGKLFAISCAAKPFKLAFQLSREFGIKLAKEKDLKFSPVGKKSQLHLNYFCAKDQRIFRLIENRGFDEERKAFAGPIFSELKDFDFTFYCESHLELESSEFLKRLRMIPEINLVTEFDPNRLKNKDYLISDQ